RETCAEVVSPPDSVPDQLWGLDLPSCLGAETTTFPNRRVRPELWSTMGSKPLQSLAGWTVIRSWQWT
ncbi:hypothetical protein PspLS_10986, partial [Pyricularia sp. CBS 133598]